jgi:hypothetical protein
MSVSPIANSYPLSVMQQGMLFHSLSNPHSGVDIEQIIGSLHEELNVAAFKQAWQQIVQRHAVLRTSFCWEDVDEPLQEVHESVVLPWEEQDWRGRSGTQQQERLNAYLKRDRQQGFDLTQVPLMRLALFRVAEADYRFVWTFHHALLDGRSLLLVLKELFAFYEAFCQNQNLQLKRPQPYRAYIDWLGTQDFTQAEHFWQQTLSGFTTPTPLTVDRIHSPKSDQASFGRQEIRLSETTTLALQALAEQHQLTLNTLLQGAWALLLSRYSGEAEVVFGATRACRRSALEGAESIVGLLINTLPVKVSVPPHQSLILWLKELRAQWIAVRNYEHIPLVKIQKWSDVPAGHPLFESILVFENYELNSALRSQADNWNNREFCSLGQSNYPLTVLGWAESQLRLQITYSQHRFDPAAIARM